MGKRYPAVQKASRRHSLFGPPPLLEGEDRAAYDELFTRVSQALRPIDFIEVIWLHDIVDLTWESSRWRQLKTKVLEKEAPAVPFDCFMDAYEKIAALDRLTAIAEERRNAVLREIDRRRSAAFTRALRDRIQEIESEKVQTIEAAAIALNNATNNHAS